MNLTLALSGGVPGLIAASAAPAVAATAAYTMTDLGNLGGGAVCVNHWRT